MNWQEVSIYVATSEGVYIYDAKDNALDPVLAGDFRAATGTQPFVKDAAVNLPSLRFCDLLDQPSHPSEWTASEDSPKGKSPASSTKKRKLSTRSLCASGGQWIRRRVCRGTLWL